MIRLNLYTSGQWKERLERSADKIVQTPEEKVLDLLVALEQQQVLEGDPSLLPVYYPTLRRMFGRGSRIWLR